MTNDKKKLLGHGMAYGTQIMWGATFVSTKVLLSYFLPAEVLFTRALLAFFALLLFYPHHLKLKKTKQELAFAGAGLFGIVLYFMLENTALTMTYASNVGIIVACAPFFVAVMVGFFFKNERSGIYFYIGFVVAIAGVILISLNGQKNLQLNPLGDGLAFLAMISWGCYSALVRKIGEWEYPVIAVTRRIYFYRILFLGLCASAMGFLLWNLSTKWIGAVKTSVYIYVSPVVTVVLSMLVLHEKITLVSLAGSILIFIGLIISQKK
jgi:drug/metabolite transporter (DMT)-like permease